MNFVLLIAGIAAIVIGAEVFLLGITKSQFQDKGAKTDQVVQRNPIEAQTHPIRDAQQAVPTSTVTSTLKSETEVKNQTARWETYKSQSLGFSIEYPLGRGFEVREQNNSVFIMVPQSDYGLVITVWDNPRRLTPISWLRETLTRGLGNASLSENKTSGDGFQVADRQVAGQLAKEVRPQELPAYVIFPTPNGEELIQVSGSTLEQELFDQILASFKFSR